MGPKAKAKATKAGEPAPKKVGRASTGGDATTKSTTPKASRKSATDFFDDDGAKVEIQPDTISEETKTSKVDKHPVKTAKTKRGDRIEVKEDTLVKGIKRKAEDAEPKAADEEAVKGKKAPATQKAKKRKSTADGGEDAEHDETAKKPAGAKRQRRSLVEQAGDLVSAGLDAAKKGAQALDNALREEPIVDDATEAVQTAKSAGKKAASKAKAAVSGGTEAADGAAEAIKTNANTAKGKAKAAGKKAADKAEEITEAAPDAGDAKAATKKASKIVEDAANKVAKEAPDAAQVKKAATKASKKAKATAETTMDAVAESAPAQTAAKASKKTKATAKTAADAAAESSAVQEVKTTAKKAGSKVEEVAQHATDAAPSIEAVKQKGKKAGKKAQSTAQGVADEAAETIESAAAAAPSAADAKQAAKKTKSKAKGMPEKVAEAIASVTEAAIEDVKSTARKASGKAKAAKDAATEAVDEILEVADEIAPGTGIDMDVEEGSEDEEEDADVGALIAGFDDEDEDEDSGDEGYKPGKAIPKLPNNKGLKPALKKAKANKDDETTGVIYVGHIPHGFHEHEMRSYFSQFGDVNKVRLSRSRKTGASKHYAFIEFAHHEVAKIVANTMNNYLMFGHILKCNLVPAEQVHEKLWIGANKRFKKVPWSKIEGRKLALPKARSQWEKKTEKEAAKRAAKAEEMKKLGYEMPGAALTSVSAVPAQSTPKALQEAAAAEMVETEQSIVVANEGGNMVTVTEKIEKKRAPKRKAPAEAGDAPAKEVVKKTKKTTKAKA